MSLTSTSSSPSSSQITTRIDKLCYGLDMNYVDPIEYVCPLYVFALTLIRIQGYSEGRPGCLWRSNNSGARRKSALVP